MELHTNCSEVNSPMAYSKCSNHGYIATSSSEMTSLKRYAHKECEVPDNGRFEVNIAIDFGTTFTGFAFSFRKNKTVIETGKRKLGDDRIPAVVLFKPDKTVHSMGLKAEETYAALVTVGDHLGYRLFRHFKMSLYLKDKLTRDVTIKDVDGKPMKAIEVFQAVIRHMKTVAVEMVSESLLGNADLIKNNILWIMTIPAIWSDSARQFMHEAAVSAGIDEKQLRIVLEPEAAAISSRKELLFMTDTSGVEFLPTGTKYILVDLGGGTADICSHEIYESGIDGKDKIRELFRATGGAYGGSFVDEKVIQFLIKIFGSDVWGAFRCKHVEDYLLLVREINNSKLDFDDKTEEIIIRIPVSIMTLLEKETNCSAKDIIMQGSYSKYIRIYKYKLVLKRKLMEDFFCESVQGILSHLKNILDQCRDENINAILLVGGYAESPYVSKMIFNEMKKLSMRVIIVPNPRLSVMKGAVMLGYEDRRVMQRKSRVTYGFDISVPFVKGKHPEAYKFIRDGKLRCGRIFKKLIEREQYVEYGQEFKASVSDSRTLQESKEEKLYIRVFVSERKNPTYCRKEENCTEVGKIVVDPPEEGWPDQQDADMFLIVHESTMTCKVVVLPSGETYFTDVDFLSYVLET